MDNKYIEETDYYRIEKNERGQPSPKVAPRTETDA